MVDLISNCKFESHKSYFGPTQAEPENALPLCTRCKGKHAVWTRIEAKAPINSFLPVVSGTLDCHTISFLETNLHTPLQIPMAWLTKIIITFPGSKSRATATTMVATIGFLLFRLQFNSCRTGDHHQFRGCAAQRLATPLQSIFLFQIDFIVFRSGVGVAFSSTVVVIPLLCSSSWEWNPCKLKGEWWNLSFSSGFLKIPLLLSWSWDSELSIKWT